jgi:prepilin-type N-terminal cleavage/methylation domain-containing protein
MKNGKTGFTHTPICTVTGQTKAVKEQLCHRISTPFTACKLVRGFTLPELLVVIVIIAFSLSLCAALVPSMDRTQESARRALCANQLRQVGTAMAVYADCFGGFLPWYAGTDPSFKNTQTQGGSTNCVPQGSPDYGCPADGEIHPYVAFRDSGIGIDKNNNLIPMRLGCLYAAGIVEDARLFYCPSETDPMYQYDSYINPMLPPNTSTEWGTLPQQVNAGYNQYVRVGNTYYPTDPQTLKRANGTPNYTARRFDRMDVNIPYLTDRIWKRDGVRREELEERGGRPKPIAHRMGRIYSLNALFKDNHTIYYKNQDIFRSDLWWRADEFQLRDTPGPDYREFFYGVYRAIGKVGEPLVPAPYFQQNP